MKINEFLKISKFEITFLVDMVAVAGFLSVKSSLNHFILLIPLLLAGTLASMSASIFNNVYDMDIDKKMKRTSSRESIINSKNFKTISEISGFMLLAALIIGIVFINVISTIFIFAGFVSYVALYTMLLKRRTSWNIVIGGIAGSFPALAGSTAIFGNITITSIFIASLVFMWTPTHFWTLATNNVDDYTAAGIPMLPSKIGIKRGAFWILVNTVVLVSLSILPFFFREIKVGLPYYVLAIVLDAYLLYSVLQPFTHNYAKTYFKKAFHFSNIYLLLLLIALFFVNVV
ncbi:heme o synthase [Oxyplasma meridianum]|uniref:Protoheme IX farnesyltransferase n=1 Tax=Oxyplasma meridianum TaxID=3073602 RepID=A0AAX4NGY4_9ARCH